MIQLRVVGLVRYTFFFFFNDPATTEIYTLSQHDALPISVEYRRLLARALLDDGYRDLLADPRLCGEDSRAALALPTLQVPDRKSTRLNSSHGYISYAVFCLKKKKTVTYALP